MRALSLGHKCPYERRTNDVLTIYEMVKNRSYGVRKGICDQGFTVTLLQNQIFFFFVYIFIHISANMSPFGLKFSQMILYTETSILMYNWSFLFVVLHKPTLLPSTFKLWIFISFLPNKLGNNYHIFK